MADGPISILNAFLHVTTHTHIIQTDTACQWHFKLSNSKKLEKHQKVFLECDDEKKEPASTFIASALKREQSKGLKLCHTSYMQLCLLALLTVKMMTHAETCEICVCL